MLRTVIFANVLFAFVSSNLISDLRKTYDCSLLMQGDAFSTNLARAFEYVQSVNNGYKQLVLGATTDIQIFKEFYGAVPDNEGNYAFQEFVESKTHFIWTFYATHLAHLIKDETPKSEFYEFFTNLYSHLKYDIAVLNGQIKFFQKIAGHPVRSTRFRGPSTSSKLTKGNALFVYFEEVSEQLYGMDSIDVEGFDRIMSEFIANIQKWSQDQNFHENNHGGLSYTISQIMMLFRLYEHLYPVVQSNQAYFTVLTSTCGTKVFIESEIEKTARELLQTTQRTRNVLEARKKREDHYVSRHGLTSHLRIHQLLDFLHENEINPDYSRVASFAKNPYAIVDAISFKAFQGYIKDMSASVTPFMKPFHVAAVDSDLPPKILRVPQITEQIHTTTSLYLSWYLNEHQANRDAEQYNQNTDAFGDGAFQHKRPEIFYRIIEQGDENKFARIPLNAFELSFREFQTLCAIMYSDKGFQKTKLVHLEKLIEKLGGSIVPIAGHMDRVFVPTFGSQSIMWLRTSSGTKLSEDLLTSARLVLSSLKVDPLDFEFISTN